MCSCMYRGTDRVICGFSTAWRVGTLSLSVVQGSALFALERSSKLGRSSAAGLNAMKSCAEHTLLLSGPVQKQKARTYPVVRPLPSSELAHE